jgi:predicted nucleotidyltransferase
MLSQSVALANSILMLHADAPLTVAQVVRATGLKYTPAASALATLEKRGVVRRVRRAGQDAFEANRDDPHYPAAYISALVDLPLQDAFRGVRPYAVFAYGSLARPGGGTAHSDLDLLLIADVKDREGLLGRLSMLGARLGRTIDPFILDPQRFEQARRRHDAHVESALAGVRILGSI